MAKVAIVFFFYLLSSFISSRPIVSLSGWYTIHFKDGNTETPVKDSVFKAGVFVKVADGLKVYASAYRLGGWLMQKKRVDFSGKVVYMKWKVNVGHEFADIHAVFYPTTDAAPDFYKKYTLLSYLSTRNQWDESVKIPYGEDWYYTRIVFEKDSITSFTATDNYDNKAGVVIQKFRKPLSNPVGHIGMSFNDVYAGASAWFVLGELYIRKK
jgi:hypothetical protein